MKAFLKTNFSSGKRAKSVRGREREEKRDNFGALYLKSAQVSE